MGQGRQGSATTTEAVRRRVHPSGWLPLYMKIRHGEGKWALRQVLYKCLPRELTEGLKAGFALPVGHWLRGPLREWVEELRDEVRLNREGYFNPAPIYCVWQEHLSGRHEWMPRIWSVRIFQACLESVK